MPAGPDRSDLVRAARGLCLTRDVPGRCRQSTLTYEFTRCEDSDGAAVPDFQAVKQLSEAAALHLLDGSGNFVLMKAEVEGDQTVNGIDYEDGQILFATPGFDTNGLPTITCTNTSPLSGITAKVTGYIAPS